MYSLTAAHSTPPGLTSHKHWLHTLRLQPFQTSASTKRKMASLSPSLFSTLLNAWASLVMSVYHGAEGLVVDACALCVACATGSSSLLAPCQTVRSTANVSYMVVVPFAPSRRRSARCAPGCLPCQVRCNRGSRATLEKRRALPSVHTAHPIASIHTLRALRVRLRLSSAPARFEIGQASSSSLLPAASASQPLASHERTFQSHSIHSLAYAEARRMPLSSRFVQADVADLLRTRRPARRCTRVQRAHRALAVETSRPKEELRRTVSCTFGPRCTYATPCCNTKVPSSNVNTVHALQIHCHNGGKHL